MKKILVAMWLACLMTSVSHAGEVKVAWHEPEQFTDNRLALSHPPIVSSKVELTDLS